MRRDLLGPYPAGVPTPYVAHVHPYPTRFHGGIWTRPVFGMPTIAQPGTVFIPGRDMTMGPDRPLRGLGAAEELMYNTGRGIFRPGGEGGGVFDGNIAGLGADTQAATAADAADYPWGKYSDKTKALQQATNVALQRTGYCPIAADGKLGPATCGARNRLSLDAEAAGEGTFYDIPSTCTDYKLPNKLATGCGTGGGAPAVVPGVSTKPGPTTASMTTSIASPGLSSSSKKALALLAGGLGALGIVYVIKKRKR